MADLLDELGGTPLYCRVSLRASHWLARHASGLLGRLVGHRVGPPATQVGALQRCGHVPMTGDPAAVTELITTAAARAVTRVQTATRGRRVVDRPA